MMSFLLDGQGLKTYADNVVAIPIDAHQLKEDKKEMVKAKRMILDGVQDQIVSHIGQEYSQRDVGCSRRVISKSF